MVIGHAKTDILLQQLFWLQPFSICQAPKTFFFTSFSTGPPEFCPGWIFNFLPKSGRPGLGIRPQPKISIYECIFLMSCKPFYLGHFFFCFCWFLLSFSSMESYLTLVGWQKNIFNNFGMHTAHSPHFCCPDPAGKLIFVFAQKRHKKIKCLR